MNKYEYDAMFENLTNVQNRCTALLEENRALKKNNKGEQMVEVRIFNRHKEENIFGGKPAKILKMSANVVPDVGDLIVSGDVEGSVIVRKWKYSEDTSADPIVNVLIIQN